MQDAPGVQSQIQTIKEPEHKNLIKLAENYHNAVCENEKCIIYEKKLPLIKISIVPFVGLTKYNGYDKELKEFGGYLYFWSPRSNENIYIKTGLVYHTMSIDDEEYKVDKIPLQFQYFYRAHRIQPSISAGANIFNLLSFDDSVGILGYTFSLNAGLDYRISNKISLGASLNTDWTPIGLAIALKD